MTNNVTEKEKKNVTGQYFVDTNELLELKQEIKKYVALIGKKTDKEEDKKRYLTVNGWRFILDRFRITYEVSRPEVLRDGKGDVIGYECYCDLYKDGIKLGSGFSAFEVVFNKEGREKGEKPVWNSYSKLQTRSLGKACQNVFGYLLNYLELETTLAEEVMDAVAKVKMASKEVEVFYPSDKQKKALGEMISRYIDSTVKFLSNEDRVSLRSFMSTHYKKVKNSLDDYNYFFTTMKKVQEHGDFKVKVLLAESIMKGGGVGDMLDKDVETGKFEQSDFEVSFSWISRMFGNFELDSWRENVLIFLVIYDLLLLMRKDVYLPRFLSSEKSTIERLRVIINGKKQA